MKKVAIILATVAFLCAVVDIVHGQHNGDAHRSYIHVPELVSLLLFVGVLEILAYRKLDGDLRFSKWVSVLILSLVSTIIGCILFGLSGGSAHGDGGPIAATFGVTGYVGLLGIPVSLAGLLISRLRRA